MSNGQQTTNKIRHSPGIYPAAKPLRRILNEFPPPANTSHLPEARDHDARTYETPASIPTTPPPPLSATTRIEMHSAEDWPRREGEETEAD